MDLSCATRDIWLEISSKIPADDVVELRRVSKFHRNLIDSPDFSRKNYEQSTKTNRHVLLSSNHRVDFRSSVSTVYSLINPFEKWYGFNNHNLVGCCMGILCYKLLISWNPLKIPSEEYLIFWNPLTGCSRKVAHEPTQPGCNYQFLLGFDAVTDDLKVLKLRQMRFGVDCEIYSSKMNSWTKLRMDGCIDEPRFKYSCHVFVEGTNSTHWLSEKHITAFDFSAQKFCKFPLPKITESDRYLRTYRMSSLGGCLSLCMYSDSQPQNHLDVWTMKEYGVEESWSMLISITHSINKTHLEPLFFLNNGSQLVILSPGDGLYLYDVKTMDVKKQLDFQLLQLGAPQAFVYTPTLRKLNP